MPRASSKKCSFPVFVVVLILLAGPALVAFVWCNLYTVPVMMYHKVRENPEGHSDTVSPKMFRFQMQYLKEHGYHVLTLDELVEGITQGRRLPHKSVVITFDDGYENNYTEALPVLEQYSFPATIFISPEYFGRAEYLSVEQIAAMKDSLFSLGSHGMSQAYLPKMSRTQREYEITESQRLIEGQFGVPVKYFCYPIGGFNEEIKDMVKSAGFKAALTTNRGHDRFDKDVFEINRIKFSDSDNSDLTMWVKLLGYYNLFRKLKSPE